MNRRTATRFVSRWTVSIASLTVSACAIERVVTCELMPDFMRYIIYIKDISFETPNSPNIFREEWKPQTEVNLNTRANRLEEMFVNLVEGAA